MATRVVNLKHTTGGGVVYIGRPSPWGNPYRIGPDGTREEVIAKYLEWVANSSDPRACWIRTHLHYLQGKALGCWCAPLPCHGDVLVELIEGEHA